MRKSEGAVKLLVFRALKALERQLGPEFQSSFPPRLEVASRDESKEV
jgi:hypothetical protein